MGVFVCFDARFRRVPEIRPQTLNMVTATREQKADKRCHGDDAQDEDADEEDDV